MTRPTAAIRDTNGNPIDRDDYAAALWDRVEDTRGDERRPLLSDGEAAVVADLLDELAGVYGSEEMGRLARSMAVLIHDRRGV